MGACVYLRILNANVYESALVVGKSLLFPQTRVSKFSIARKELVALCMGAYLLKQCQAYISFSISQIFVWVDSTTVIKWCQCTLKQLKQFVRNRIDKILEITEEKAPKYVRTKENPADVASRGIKQQQTKELNLWLKDPSFLRHPSGK